MNPVRVRFAPSPTGALHIGGLRTALYNYLFARRNEGVFVLRIEDTDQKRYVEGAEEYIAESLAWCGISPDEGPQQGGNYGPYRQSERREIYAKYTQRLLDNGRAYLAFDTEEELNARREAEKAAGNHNFRYDASTRSGMRNSLSLSAEETTKLLESDAPRVVRLRVDPGHTVTIHDIVRGRVDVASAEVDDKVLMKADGLPTYHLANVVDDHLMRISHVIRGEEWLPSTALHLLLYRAFGWEESMPQFAHLPLLLKPTGKGKLSKRDGQKLGIPVFPISWEKGTPEEFLQGFREAGLLPAATINFLAFLGWNPGTEQELFTLPELVAAFSLDRINKSGARFDFDKAKWFNQQYLIHTDEAEIAPLVKAHFVAGGYDISHEKAVTITGMLKERVHLLPEFLTKGRFFVEAVTHYEKKPIRKKWKPDRRPVFEQLLADFSELEDWSAPAIKATTVAFMERNELGFGAVLPVLRVAISGTVQGPDAFEMLAVVGREATLERLRVGYDAFDAIKAE